MSATEDMKRRLQQQAADGNLDIEDVEVALRAARADGRIDVGESWALEVAQVEYLQVLEPSAAAYLQAVIGGRDVPPPARVLLAPPPRGRPADLYHARNDVVALQDALGRLGYSTTPDGDYGPGTTRQVAAFQAAFGLPTTGLLDGGTLVEMNQQLAARGQPLLDITPRARIRPDQVIALRRPGATRVTSQLQAALVRLGRKLGWQKLEVDGDGLFGAKTEQAVKTFQAWAFLPATGIVDGATVAALDLALRTLSEEGLSLTPPSGGAGFQGQVELHFYPGEQERKLYVLQSGRLLASYGMVGGRPEAAADPRNPKVDYSPTPAGRYEVVEVNPHASSAWTWSYVPWGAALREQAGEIQFRAGDGRWQWATGPAGVFQGRDPAPLERSAYLDGSGTVLPTWQRNDFGHLRARLRELATGVLQGHMVHPIPGLEGTEAYFQDTAALCDPGNALDTLRYSHGCEHIHPRDLDDLISRGFLDVGTRFVVHGYDEHYQGALV